MDDNKKNSQYDKIIEKLAQLNINPQNVEQHVYLARKQFQPLPSSIPLAKGFVGREIELENLREAKLSGRTSFVLHGLGGVGKTEIALQFISEIKSEFQFHIRVDMRGLDETPLSSQDAMLEIVKAFKPNVSSETSQKDVIRLCIQFLNQYKTLIFLDNAKDRHQVEPLNYPMAFVVITSRNSFNVSGGFSKEINEMSFKDAKALLYSVADEERFDGRADELAYLAGYLPMALLPLASLLAEDITLEVASLLQKYANRKERLRLEDPNRENLSVDASFDLSYEQLNDELKERWRKLAVFPFDFNLEAMKVIWQTQDAETSRSALVKSHLLIFNVESRRARLHDLARDYTQEKLKSEELFETEKHHATFYGQFLRKLTTLSLENLNQFDTERTNIEKGFTWVKDKIELDETITFLCLEYTGRAADILTWRFNPQQYSEWMQAGFMASQRLNFKLGESTYLSNLGLACLRLGEYQKARDYADRALKISSGTEFINRNISETEFYNHDLMLSNVHSDLTVHISTLTNEFHNSEIELRKLQKSLFNAKAFSRSSNFVESLIKKAINKEYRQAEGMQLGILGNIYLHFGQYDLAISIYDEALQIAVEVGDQRGKCIHLANLGNAYKKLGVYLKAINYCEQALLIAREFGNKQHEGNCLSNLAVACEMIGEHQKAIEYSEQALLIAREIRDQQGESSILTWLGRAYGSLGEHQRAINYCKQALFISTAIGDQQGEGNCLINLSIVYLSLGEKEEAKDLMTRALTICETHKSPNTEFARNFLAKLEKNKTR